MEHSAPGKNDHIKAEILEWSRFILYWSVIVVAFIYVYQGFPFAPIEAVYQQY